MRLVNSGTKVGKDYYRVVLDSQHSATNYVEKSKNCYHDESTSDYLCDKCMSFVVFTHWNKNDTRGKGVCPECNQEVSLTYVHLNYLSKVSTIG